MKKHLFLFVFFVGAAAVLFTPIMSKAELVPDCTVTSSDPLDEITQFSPPSNPPDPNIVETVAGFMYTADTGSATYDVTCTVTSDATLNSAPMVMAGGFNVAYDDFTITQNSDTEYVYSISGVAGDFYPPDDTPSEPNQEWVYVFIATGSDPTPQNPEQSGPPASMGGGFISTTVQEFQISPPSGPDEFGFGLTLDGPPNTTGFFKMYMPASMLALMSTMSGKTITVDDMAVFIDDDQASTTISETDAGGALININVTFTSGNTSTATSALVESETVSKSIEAKEKLALSAAFVKTSVLRDKYAKLYGWKKTNFKNKAVKIFRKKKGDDSYTLVDTVYTDNAGYYLYKFKPKTEDMAKGTYYFKTKCSGLTSLKQTLKVK